MSPSSMRSFDRSLRDRLASDPVFRESWERTALARAVANRVIGYRKEHGLTQTALAQRLGWKQPAISRLELGETNPTIETLRLLSRELGIEFLVAVAPTRTPTLVGDEIRRARVRERIGSGGSHVVIAVT